MFQVTFLIWIVQDNMLIASCTLAILYLYEMFTFFFVKEVCSKYNLLCLINYPKVIVLENVAVRQPNNVCSRNISTNLLSISRR